MTGSLQKEWAQLVCSTDLDTSPIPIYDDNFTIGRAKVCNLSLEDNKMVSGKHCRIMRTPDGYTWVEDISTNGTWINKTKLHKGQKLLITHGDEIFLVKKPGSHVAYVFQETEELDKEEECDQTLAYDEEEEESESTQNYDATSDQPIDQSPTATSAAVKRARPEDSSEEQKLTKRLHIEAEVREETAEDATNKSPEETATTSDAKTGADVIATSSDVKATAAGSDEKAIATGSDDKAVAISSDKAIATSSDDKAIATSSDDKAVATSSDDKATADAFLEFQKKGKPSKMWFVRQSGDSKDSKVTPKAAPVVDNMAATLVCSICQDIFHDCVSLQPCMHSFCGGCYSPWMDQAKTCPTCRNNVQRINKNHIVNNLVEAYFKEHPEKQRSEDELKELDAKNQITRDMLLPKRKPHEYIDSDDASEYEVEDDDDDDDDDDDSNQGPSTVSGTGYQTSSLSQRPSRTVCRQCSGYVPLNNPNFGTVVELTSVIHTSCSTSLPKPGAAQALGISDKPSTSETKSDQLPLTTANLSTHPEACIKTDIDKSGTSSGPSTTGSSTTPNTSISDGSGTQRIRITPSGEVVPMPTAPLFLCGFNCNHLICMCCYQAMPDRRPLSSAGTAKQEPVPPMKCAICGIFFCHMYWGCQKITCLGCLNKFKDMNFGDKCTTNFVNNNPFESEILQKYLQAQNKSWRDVLSHSLVKLDANQYTCPGGSMGRRITSETPVCDSCGFKNFQQLAYQYRKDIPRDQLPVEAMNRSDCYWGKNCRTQFNKPLHARQYNHICDQTRF